MTEPQSLQMQLEYLQAEVKALQLANSALQEQLLDGSDQTDAMLRSLEAQKDDLKTANSRQRALNGFVQRVIDTVGSLVIVCDPSGLVVRANRSSIEFFGERINVAGSVKVDEWLPPADYARLLGQLGKVPWAINSVLYETVRREGRYRQEHLLKGSNGQMRIFLLEASLLYSDQGKEEGMVLSGTDITLLKQVKDELHLSASVFEKCLNGITITTPDGIIENINAAFTDVFGYTKQDCIGRPASLLKSGKQEKPFYKAMWNALATDGHWSGEIWNRSKQGKIIPIWQTISAVYNDSGEVNHYIGIFFDISEMKALEQQLRDAKAAADSANEAKSGFLAAMSHEIRTPMNGILGMIKLLTHTELTTRQLDYAKKAESATKALLGIINDILDFSKVEAGRIDLDYCNFSPSDLFRELSVMLSSNQGSKDIEVLIAPDPNIPETLVGDTLRLRQVLINLTGNALKFTERGEVIISISLCPRAVDDMHRDRVELEFSVQDSGIGIPADKLDHIFESFSQADSSTARKFGGTGLGLAISKRLVALMGGELRVESTVGKGSRFYFTLPFEIASNENFPAFQTSAISQYHNLNVLIVDDNATSREILKVMVEAKGWRCDCMPSGEAALARLEAVKPDYYQLILMDWRMPGLDGWETTCRIRRAMQGNTAPVIVMVTAHGLELLDEKTKAEADILLDGYLFKPVTASMLFDAVVAAKEKKNGMPKRNSLAQNSRSLAGMRLLVVDDNLINQQIAQELLEQNGAVVEIAGNGMSAVAKSLAANPPHDAILMDIQMPDIDGFEAAKRIREHPHMQGVPIIAMTANAMESDREACLAAGMVDHVSKPIDLDKLIQTLLIHTADHFHPDQAKINIEIESFADTAPLMDIEGAVNRLGGHRDLYKLVAKSFLSDGPTQLAEMKQYLQQGKLRDAARCVHTFKGLVATLGATTLAQIAAATEKLFQQPAADFNTTMQQHVDEMDKLLEQVIQSLETITVQDDHGQSAPAALPKDQGVRAVLDKTAFHEELKKLIELLQANNMRAMGVCSKMCGDYSDALSSSGREQLFAVEKEVSALNFTQALAGCKTLFEL